MIFLWKTRFLRLWVIGVTYEAEIFRNLIFFHDKTVYQIWAKSDKIFSFLFGTLEPGLNRGEKGCNTTQNLCSWFFLNAEDPKLQYYHSFGGVLANLKFDFFLALKVKFFWDFYIYENLTHFNFEVDRIYCSVLHASVRILWPLSIKKVFLNA